MNGIMYLLAIVAVVAYVVFIFIPRTVSRNLFIAGDALMAVVLVSLILEESSSLLLIASLLWLICNYAFGLPHKDSRWSAYDGFTIATVLSYIGFY